MEELKGKRLLFVKEYLVDLNQTQATIRAGYSPKGAKSQGNRLMKDPLIFNAIIKGMEKRAQRIEITADKVLAELGKIGFSDLVDFIEVDDKGCMRVKDIEEMNRGLSACLSEITEHTTVKRNPDKANPDTVLNIQRKIKLHPKVEALKLLGQHLDIFETEFSLKDVTVIIQTVDKDPRIIKK